MSRGKPIILFTAAIGGVIFFALAASSLGEEGHESTSVGGPNDGSLLHGLRLPPRGPGFISNPGRTNRGADWGTKELVDAIVKIGADVQRWAPGPELVVNDLSLPEGGEIPRHQSHDAGRDVDLLFYMLTEEGAERRARAARFDDEGRARLRGRGGGSVRFDVHRNWLVLKSLVLNRTARLQRVFVAEGLRELMLTYAEERDEQPWLIERAAQAMCEPAVPHDDHFHIRLFCTAEDYRRGCRDSWPIYPWHRTNMARLGIPAVETAAPRRTSRRRRRPQRRVPAFGRTWCPSPR